MKKHTLVELLITKKFSCNKKIFWFPHNKVIKRTLSFDYEIWRIYKSLKIFHDLFSIRSV